MQLQLELMERVASEQVLQTEPTLQVAQEVGQALQIPLAW
jgi:hypothetical protein